MSATSPAALATEPDESPDWLQRGAMLRGVPAWLASLLLHATTFTILGLCFQEVQRGVPYEPGRTIGVSLAQGSGTQTEYFSGDSESSTEAPTLAAATPSPSSAQDVLPTSDEAPTGSGPQLPTSSGLGTRALPGESEIGGGNSRLPTASGIVGKGRSGKGLGNEVQTGVFGVQGVGSRFVYVFDRSSSMLGYGGRPLASAKRELLASLEKLQKVHQFQIIFYNERPTLFDPYRSQQPGMFFADDKGKRLAEDFVRGVPAEGSTQHVDALKMAIKMRPDVIFFLTDGDEPRLHPNELADLRRLNRGTSINAIEFGPGPARGGDNFLKQLARENEGQYGYLDVTQLPDGR